MNDVSFLGPTLMPEIKKSIPMLNSLPKQVCVHAAEMALRYLKGNEIDETQVEEFSGAHSITTDQCAQLLTGLFFIYRAAYRAKTKPAGFRQGLDELKLPNELSISLNSLYKKNAEEVTASALERTLRFPRVESMRHRIDVAISTSSMSLVLKPSVLVELGLSNGEEHMFEISPLRFQQLRYNVAKVLKEMQDLEKLAILKVQK